jgi:hypothetical protein
MDTIGATSSKSIGYGISKSPRPVGAFQGLIR